MDDSRHTVSRGVEAGLVLLLGLSILLTYVDRGAIAIAAPLLKGELGLSATEFGIVVSAFFWIYAPLQVAVGWMCDRMSVYRLFTAGVALWAVCTLLTGLATGFAMLLVLRIGLGIGESICFPGASKIIARHVPPARRGISNAVVVAGIAFGPAVGTLLGGMILAGWGWRPVFFVFGAVTLLWLVPWMLLVRRLDGGDSVAPVRVETPYPIARLLRVPALWVMGAVHFCGNFGFYFAVSWLPLYLVQERGFSLQTMTVMTTATFLTQGVVAVLAGHATDRWTASGRSEAAIRRTFAVVGQTGAAIGILGIAFSGSEAELLAWMILAGVAFALVSINIFSIGQMFAGSRVAGSWMGVQNTLANLAGILGPIITGVIIDATGSYQAAFITAAAVGALGAVLWAVVLPAIRQVELD